MALVTMLGKIQYQSLLMSTFQVSLTRWLGQVAIRSRDRNKGQQPTIGQKQLTKKHRRSYQGGTIGTGFPRL